MIVGNGRVLFVMGRRVHLMCDPLGPDPAAWMRRRNVTLVTLGQVASPPLTSVVICHGFNVSKWSQLLACWTGT
jgi:hypothetical protein